MAAKLSELFHESESAPMLNGAPLLIRERSFVIGNAVRSAQAPATKRRSGMKWLRVAVAGGVLLPPRRHTLHDGSLPASLDYHPFRSRIDPSDWIL